MEDNMITVASLMVAYTAVAGMAKIAFRDLGRKQPSYLK
jgi:hypothetical protein